MLTSELLKTFTEEELGILFLIAENIFKFPVSYNSLKVIKKNVLINILEQLKPQILEENKIILENFQKKLIEYN